MVAYFSAIPDFYAPLWLSYDKSNGRVPDMQAPYLTYASSLHSYNNCYPEPDTIPFMPDEFQTDYVPHQIT